MIRLFSAAIAVILVATAAFAEPVQVGSITIDKAWSRATPKAAKAGGGYMAITNNGDSTDKLIAVSSEAARKTEIHNMSIKDGVMHMAPVDGGLEIKPGETVELKPGGYHVMFMGLKAPLKMGDMVMVKVQFENAGMAMVHMPIAKIGAKAMDHSMHNQSD